MARLWEEFTKSSTAIKITVITVVTIWGIAVLGLAVGAIYLWERPGMAEPPSPGATMPLIVLEPAIGPVDTPMTIHGQGWPPGSTILIYLAPPDETGTSGYALASAVTDPTGQFLVTVFIPAGPRWESPGLVRVIARTIEGEEAAQALFSLIGLPGQPLETPISPLEPTETPTPTVEPTATPIVVVQPPTPTPQPGNPLVIATTDVNIRSGPDTAYPILGILRTGQSADVTGVSPDGRWWQIRFAGAADGRGWVAGRYVTAQNTNNVPVTLVPVLPPTPTPVVISDWRGEYYNNLALSGAPAVVRNDVSVNFDWGTSAPAAGIAADNFSARWTRSLNFPGGTYRFYVRVDDGARLWIDGNLVVDQWHDAAPTTYTTDVTLSEGAHNLRLEYYEHTGEALAQLAWERLEAYPDWKGEYFDNPNLSGTPVLVRNDLGILFNWGPNSPGPGVPADNFSARWTRNLHFSAGTYRFKVMVDDGVRLWVDDLLIIDRWRAGDPANYTADLTLAEGQHRLRLEYFEFRYDAQVRLDWERVDNYPDWKAEYFDNRKLQGDPVLVRNETEIDHNWGNGSPGPGVPADNFSARWTRKVDFEAGTYRIRVKVDDGVRLWIDDELVIDDWRDGSTRSLETERQVNQGQHRLKVEYYERGGEARIEVGWQKQTEPANQPPQAVPGGPYTGDEGSLVTFNGGGSRDPDGTIVAYEWDFNYNGSTFSADASGQTASTSYPDGPATITVALRVTDNKGASHLATTQVTVRNVAPTVEAGGPYSGLAGTLITMAGTATDPGLIDQLGLSYRWDFGDGTTGSGPVISHSYQQAGSYTVMLTVTDKDGAQGTDPATVQVTAPNQPPQAVISWTGQGLVGEELAFSGSGSKDPDGTIVSYVWDFGDGTTGSGANVSHVYQAAGSFQVALMVTDNGGLRDTATRSVLIQTPVTNLPPTAVIKGPTKGQVGEVLTFRGKGSSDSDGYVVSYAWNFGDGTTDDKAKATHSYAAAGIYEVTLTVVDDGGLRDTAAQSVLIEGTPPNQPPLAVITAPLTAPLSQTVTFDGSGSSDLDGAVASYAWDFGDGTMASGGVVTHTYNATGAYAVTLTVADDGGLTGSVAHNIQIEPPAAVTIEVQRAPN